MKKKISKSKLFFILSSLIFAVYFFASIPYATTNRLSADNYNWNDINFLQQSGNYQYKESGGWIYISTPEQLGYLCYQINNGNRNSSCNVKLMANLDMGTKNGTRMNWMPIKEFSGIFDGQGYSISNLKIEAIKHKWNYVYSGFIAYTANATIKNLRVSIFETCIGLKNETSHNYFAHVGNLVAYSDGSIFENCSITSNSNVSPYHTRVKGWTTNLRFGNLIGFSYLTTIKNCSSNVSLQFTDGEFNTAYAGGIVGLANNTNIELCKNMGKFQMADNVYDCYLGGIVGYLTTANGKIEFNQILKSYNSNVLYVRAKQNSYVGGIAGYIKKDGSNAKIENCFNTGKISGLSNAKTTETIYNSANNTQFPDGTKPYSLQSEPGESAFRFNDITNGRYTFTTVDSNQTVMATETYSKAYRGGICGYSNGTINACYNAGELNDLTSKYIVKYTSRIGWILSQSTNSMGDAFNVNYSINYDLSHINNNLCGINNGTLTNSYTNIEAGTNDRSNINYNVAYTKDDGTQILNVINESCSLWNGGVSSAKFIPENSISFYMSTVVVNGWIHSGTSHGESKYIIINAGPYSNNTAVNYIVAGKFLKFKPQTTIGTVEADYDAMRSKLGTSVWGVDAKINKGKPYIKDMYWANSIPSSITKITYELNDSNYTAKVKSVNTVNNTLQIPEFILHNDKYYIVTEIGDNAVKGKSLIIHVKLPQTITKIGYRAFYNCISLTTINLENVVEVGNESFYLCKYLESVNLKNIKTLGDSAFKDCDKLDSVFLSNNTKTIGNYCFADCDGLTNVNMEKDSVTSMGYSAFKNCKSLKNVTFSYKLNEIKMETFYGCTKLVSVDTGNISEITTIGTRAFANCTSLKQFIMSDSVESVNSEAFYGCTNLTLVKWSPKAGKINNKTFYNCVKLKEFIIYGSSGNMFLIDVDSIGESAFYNCSALNNINLTSRVKELKADCFFGVSSNGSIYYDGTSSQWLTLNNGNIASVCDVKVYCYNGIVEYSGYIVK